MGLSISAKLKTLEEVAVEMFGTADHYKLSEEQWDQAYEARTPEDQPTSVSIPYNAFHQWRCWIAMHAGVLLDDMVGFKDTSLTSANSQPVRWPEPDLDEDGHHRGLDLLGKLLPLLRHADNEGYMSTAECSDVSVALTVIMLMAPPKGPRDPQGRQQETTKRYAELFGAIGAAGWIAEFS